jgi:Xaa-Pro aminopeptidase
MPKKPHYNTRAMVIQDGSEAILIIAASEKDANLFYATKFLAPDPFIYIQIGKRKVLLASDLEVDRAKQEADVTEVLSVSKIVRKLKSRGQTPTTTADIAAEVLRAHATRRLLVPHDFPIRYADEFRKRGFAVRWKPEPFFEKRAIKTPEEIKAMTAVLRQTESAIWDAVELLRSSKISGKYLTHKGKRVTSEDIKRIMHRKLMEANMIGAHTIISCFNECVDPHNQGSGPLLANSST